MVQYKCYTATIDGQKAYLYFKDASVKIYANEKGIAFPIRSAENLDLVVNVALCSITDKVVHLMFNKSVPIFGVRDSTHDIEV